MDILIITETNWIELLRITRIEMKSKVNFD